MDIQHHIQRHIMKVLYLQDIASFAELRPQNIDSNQFTYHLKQLLTERYVTKLAAGKYALSQKGLQYSDRASSSLNHAIRVQPKIITLLSVHDDLQRMAIWRRPHQPYLNKNSHPTGKLHLGETLTQAAEREMKEKLGFIPSNYTHQADVYVTIYGEANEVITQVLAHCVCATIDRAQVKVDQKDIVWIKINRLHKFEYMPAFFELEHDLWNTQKFFFAEYNVDIAGQMRNDKEAKVA